MTDVSARFVTVSPGGFPNQAPRDAATLILLDRSAATPKVLLGRRHHGHVFMPGKFVFPGGRVDPRDRLMRAANPLDPRTEARLLRMVRRPTPTRARALALAAIRETFEETGLLIGTRSASQSPAPEGPWSEFAAAGVAPDLSPIRFVARAVTPPGRARRYDTRFFAVDATAIAHRIEGVVGPDTELVELVWMPIDEAKQLDLLAVTQVVLEDLRTQIAAGFGHDARVPYYRAVRGRRIREWL